MGYFAPATKKKIKGRIALAGPTGAGKTWTALSIAKVLGARTALVDTEHRSASLYAENFAFDVCEFAPPYNPSRLENVLKSAQSEGYASIIVDSLSHFWDGEGGILEIVDAAAAKSKENRFAGWKVGTPVLRHLIDVMLELDCHLIVTMRSKMEYILEETSKGTTKPTKVGMSPIMRDGVKYEFALVGELDLAHRLTVTKSRCAVLADKVFPPHQEGRLADSFLAWLQDGEQPPEPVEAPAAGQRISHQDKKARLVALCAEHGLSDPQAIRGRLSEILDREVVMASDLSAEDLDICIGALTFMAAAVSGPSDPITGMFP